MAGLEAACVSVAARAGLDGEPTDGRRRDRLHGRDQVRRSASSPSAARASSRRPRFANTELSRMFWAYGLRGRPVRADAEVLGDLIDASSVGGGNFDLGSATFDMTRVVTGQLDAYVEPGPRIVAEVPGMRGGVRARRRRRGAQQLPLRRGRGGPDPRGGRRGRHRRLRASRSATARCSARARVPDVVRGRRHPGAARRDRAARSTWGSSGCAQARRSPSFPRLARPPHAQRAG